MKTRQSGGNLAGSQIVTDALEDALYDATLRMKRDLVSGVPHSVRSVLYDVTRADRRRSHLLGRFPEVAIAFASKGAPLHDVLAPVRELEAFLKAQFYLSRLPALETAQQLETDAEWRLNKVQLILDRHSPKHVIAQARDAAVGHRSAIETLLDVLDATYHSPALRLIA
jgi:hypothetical protein